ncbi:hypothetical protein TSMEX_001847 [Taenia solium]|eukprot:TsM_001154900 transcript=TsM_001154900 gene=TsM_001154900
MQYYGDYLGDNALTISRNTWFAIAPVVMDVRMGVTLCMPFSSQDGGQNRGFRLPTIPCCTTDLLLMGFDRKPDQPVVNIIYYPLEVIVKQTLTNVQGLAPTVLMRVDYRVRLFDQTGRTFHPVPYQWCDCLAEHREVWCL